MTEQAFTFPCAGDRLLGIVHIPDGAAVRIGLLILVGGPQYRVGAHRQYIHLARAAAAAGIPAMRFDYRGVGDSEGVYPGFEHVGPDIDAAITAFRTRCPDLDGVVLWGLCEGASAILLAGVRNPFVKGAALVNPWVRTDQGEAQAYLKHYYGKRILSRSQWKRILRGEVRLGQSLASVVKLIGRSLKGSAARPSNVDHRPYPCRMADGLRSYEGRTLLVMSGRDLVAREFEDVAGSATEWRGLLGRSSVQRVDIAATDHTFSSESWRQAAADATISFVRDING